MPEMSVNALKNNLTNPARAYNWEVQIPNPKAGDAQTFLLRCRSTSVPGRSVGKIHLPFKQTGGIEYPGKLNFSHTWSCVFQEGEDRAIHDALYEWSQLIVNAKTGIGSISSVLKTDIYLDLVNTDATVAERIKMVGVYPEAIGDVELSQETDSAIQYNATWSYDYWVKV